MPQNCLDWKEALRFPLTQPGCGRKIFIGGLWLTLLPPIGWLLALGYRSAVLRRDVMGYIELLPDWSSNAWAIFKDGLKASLIIQCYFLPFQLLTWVLLLGDVSRVRAFALEIGVVSMASILLPPLGIPALAIIAIVARSEGILSSVGLAAICILFVGTTFLMPAAFMQIPLSGKMSHAFKVRKVLTLIRKNLRHYLVLWTYLIPTAILAVLGAGWGVLYSYLAIGKLCLGFLELSGILYKAPRRSW